jgi:hypothetical protein
MPWTTDDLVDAVELKVQSPSGGFQFSPQQVLDTAWEETMKRIVPPVRAVREDYWTTTVDLAITANVNYVRVPSRASQSTITNVWLVNGTNVVMLTRLASEQRFGLFSNGEATGPVPTVFFLEGDKIIMSPTPTQSGLYLRFMFDRRPSRFVPVASCALISAIGATTLTTSGGTWSASETVDVVQANPPCDVLLIDTACTQAAGTFTFAAGVLTNKGIAVGDYVADAGYTCVPPLPDALHPALVDFTAAAIMSAIGDYERAAALRAEIGSYYEALINTLAIRVSSQPPLVFNRDSPLRTAGWPRRGWWVGN